MSHKPTLRLSRFLLVTLFALDTISIFGYATFTLHPSLFARWPWAIAVYAASYAFFARAQILAAFSCLLCEAIGRANARWIPAFLAAFALSLLFEILGTTYGLPFGKYEYTALLGAKILTRVPWLIPLSWFSMGIASFRIAGLIAGRRSRPYQRGIVGTLLISAWDLTLEPAMSQLSQFWVWATPGSYFGAPLSNLFGWMWTGALILIAFELLNTARWTENIPPRFAILFYFANLLLPLGLVAASGLWAPLAVSAIAYLGIYAVYVLQNPRRIIFSPGATSGRY